MIQKIEHPSSRSPHVYFIHYAKLQLKVDFNDIFVHHWHPATFGGFYIFTTSKTASLWRSLPLVAPRTHQDFHCSDFMRCRVARITSKSHHACPSHLPKPRYPDPRHLRGQSFE